MFSSWEPRHITSSLSYDHLSCDGRDSRNRCDQGDGRLKREETLADLLGECPDSRVQIVDMVDDLFGDKGMVGSEVSMECLLELRDLKCNASYQEK